MTSNHHHVSRKLSFSNLKMWQSVLFITAAILTSSLTNCAEIKADEGVTSATPSETPSNGQENSNEKDIMQVMTDCNETFRIEMSYLESLNESGSFPDETDKTPKCYVRCVLENIGVLSADGRFDTTRAAEAFAGIRGGKPMNDIKDMATACSDRDEVCKCERSYNFVKCLMVMEIRRYENV